VVSGFGTSCTAPLTQRRRGDGDLGCIGFPERVQVGGEIVRRGRGVGVLVAERAAAGQGVLGQLWAA
jgi:hypothetical protein